ncbi:MAG: hypothetical protein OEQ74_04825, partial [Gammaproteobacteria bacterium]|nr:hypothetical protein [Gammaproteobacteria bacterium]
MLRQIAVILPVFLAGIILGTWAREPQGEPRPTEVRDFDHAADYARLEQMISSLTEIVNLEVAERGRLEEQIAGLADQVALLAGERTTRKDQPTQQQL